MDIKKRDFLAGGALLGAVKGLAAGAGANSGSGRRYRPARPRPPASTMLDSPDHFGTASKGGGFNKNWARTLPQVSSVDPNYKPRRVNKAIELWEDNQVAFYEVPYAPSGAPGWLWRGGGCCGCRRSPLRRHQLRKWKEWQPATSPGLRNFMQGLVDGGPTSVGASHSADGVRDLAGGGL